MFGKVLTQKPTASEIKSAQEERHAINLGTKIKSGSGVKSVFTRFNLNGSIAESITTYNDGTVETKQGNSKRGGYYKRKRTRKH